MSKEPTKYLLIVDDEAIILRVLLHHIRRFLPSEIDIVTAMSGEEAITRVESIVAEGNSVACVISDYLMHPMRGSELLIRLDEIIPESKKIMLTGHADLDAVAEVLSNIHLFRYIAKPWEPSDLEMTVSEAVRMFQYEEQLRERNKELENIQASLEEKVSLRTTELEQKNLELQQGLQYARYIQECFLPDTSGAWKYLKNLHIFNSPSETISGDFAWYRLVDGRVIISLGDSTGHGLAGALITVLATDILSQKTAKGIEPGSLHHLIHATLSELRGRLQKDAVYGEHAPGVDLAIVSIDIDSCIMEWASLNSNLILIDELNKVETLCKAKGFLNLPNFEDKVQHGVCDIKGKRVAMFSDGVYDQIGGENDKRLKLPGLIQLIENGEVFSNGICVIESCLRQWKGKNDQTDDCMWISFEA